MSVASGLQWRFLLPSHVVSTWFSREIDDKRHKPNTLPPQQEAQQKKMRRSSVVFHQDGGKLRVPLGTLETHGRTCDASMNLEDLQILFIQEGDLLFHLVLLRVHNWECPIS